LGHNARLALLAVEDATVPARLSGFNAPRATDLSKNIGTTVSSDSGPGRSVTLPSIERTCPMQTHTSRAFSLEELEHQHIAELPRRDLLAGISILGLPLLAVTDVSANINTAGPGWLISG
jgi:hypothetical protein